LKICFSISFFLFLFILSSYTVAAQFPGGRLPRLPRGGGGGGGTSDTLQRRDKSEDSVSINFYYIDSTRNRTFDSTLSDFTIRYPVPATHVDLGNLGTASRSILFSPSTTTGWDPSFHALDVYKWKLEQVRFFNTTKPYTELGYLIGKGSQQVIDLIHTQNVKPYWNVAFQYRSIISPGFFKNQKANHNNYLLSSWYQSPKKRYNNYLVILSNQLQIQENGGIDINNLKDPLFEKRDLIPITIGGDPEYGRNIFSKGIQTGNRYSELNFLMRQQYDLGKKDSIVTDSSVIPLFYPRLRFEHTIKSGKYKYHFFDYLFSEQGRLVNRPDSIYYDSIYGHKMRSDTISFVDSWRELSNDFSIYQFPDAKNLHQFIKLGIEYQIVHGNFDKGMVKESFHNFVGHGEYRNQTRNQKWDIKAFGKLFLNGNNAGDYHAYISLQRLLSQNIGSLQLGFENINRSPSYIYNKNSSFYLDDVSKSFNKENTLHYYLISNYLYLSDYYRLRQESSLFNFLKLSASKIFRLSKRWNLYSDVWLQQKTGDVDLNTPLFYTRQRLAFEGNFFKNLNISTGLEVRYHTPYKADNYAPVLGQFFYQDTATISNRPEVNAFLHFRIRSFKGFIRVENLNTFKVGDKGVQFTNNNLAAPNYAYPGLVTRFGIYWSFVN
jgi:hypothetical protein